MSSNRPLSGRFRIGCLLLALALGTPAPATRPTVSLPVPAIPEAPPAAPVVFTNMPASLPTLVLNAESVKVNIRHVATGSSIDVASNCPNHWNVSGNEIRQVALSSTHKGVSLHASSAGAQITVNGQIYQLPQGSDGSVHNLKVEDGQVIVNGQKLEPLAGSNVPAGCTGPDTLELQVPQSYQGGLQLLCNGSCVVELDSWQKGPLLINLDGQSKLVAGHLKNLDKAVIDVQGNGSAQIDGLTTHVLVANINGSGSLVVNSGRADFSNATISGTGTIKLNGSYKNLKKSVSGTGTILVGN